jgi:hypothetical protein
LAAARPWSGPLHESRALVWVLLGAFILITLYALGVRTLVPPDEGRYAEIGREMFASGDGRRGCGPACPPSSAWS